MRSVFIVFALYLVTLANVNAFEPKNMDLCTRNAKGLCKCDSNNIFGATCNVCRNSDACQGIQRDGVSVDMKCRTNALAQRESGGWCSVDDVSARNFIDGVPHFDLTINKEQSTAHLQVYRENNNNKFHAVFQCAMSECSQVVDHKTGRLFTKCLNVNECRATCQIGKGKDHWCNKVTRHFEEMEKSRDGFWTDEGLDRRMKFMCREDRKSCSLLESYGLMPEFKKLAKVNCNFGECVERAAGENLRA